MLIALLLVLNVGVGIVCNKSAEVNTADKVAASVAVGGDVRVGRAAQVAVELRDFLVDSEPGHRGIAGKYAKMDRILLADRGGGGNDSRASRRVEENRMLAVVNQAKGLSARGRVSQMRGLLVLNQKEMETLYRAMLQLELTEGISRPSWDWMVDVMMTTLRTQGADSTPVVEKLSEVDQTDRVDFTVRYYALQYLVYINGEGSDRYVEDYILLEYLRITDATISGTDLLALDNDVADLSVGREGAPGPPGSLYFWEPFVFYREPRHCSAGHRSA